MGAYLQGLMSGKELIVSNTSSTSQNAQRPVIVFQGLSDDQFQQALQLFEPPKPTKPSLFLDKTFTLSLADVCAYLEAIQYQRKDAKLFANPMVCNHFDNVMIEKFRTEDNDFSFSINEWFSDTRGEIPKALRDWDPNGFAPMPTVDITVDWYHAVTEAELAFPGFVTLLKNCMDMEERMLEQLKKRQHQGRLGWNSDASSGTKMPAPVDRASNFSEFTPSGMIGKQPAWLPGNSGFMGSR